MRSRWPNKAGSVPANVDSEAMQEHPAATGSANQPTGAEKNIRQEIEILRILSAFGIVWFHSGFDRTGLGYSGLVVFLVISAYLAVSRNAARRPLGQILSGRALRLMSPWAAWMVVYGIRNHFVDRHIIETDRGFFNGLLAGTHIHLWYLPFIFAISVGFDMVLPRVRRSGLAIGSAVVAMALLATAQWWRPWAQTHGYPSVQYCHALAGIAVGAFLGGVQNLSRMVAALSLGGILAAAGYSFWLGVDGVGQTYFVGIAISATLLLWSPRLPRRIDVRSISECMLGVYLVHILFDRMYFAIHGIPELAQPLLTFGTSLLLVWLLRRLLPKVARYVV
ncbi:MAG: hypothetical protein RL173_482 [Fibrobacterota bacterium]|jgi:surface polysaccharide O-acyltransferase-like enzyme